jgi:hypothetical protein
MDIAGRQAAVAAQAAMTAARPSEQARVTDLPEVEAVNAATETEGTLDGAAGDKGREARAALANANAVRLKETLNRIRRDDAADEWVFATVEAASGRTIAQFPDDMTLRRRAQIEQMQKAALGEGGAKVTRIA